MPYFTFFFGLQNSFTFVLRIFLLLLKICIKLIRITFIHKVLGKVQIIPRYLTVQWWAQAGIFWDEMNWKISKNVLNWPYIVISTKYLLFCYYYSMYIRGFTKFGIKVAWSLQFLGYLRTLSLKFQKARTKMKFSCLCPVGCLCLTETAVRADLGKLQFWSEPSEIKVLKYPRNCRLYATLIPNLVKPII